MEVDRWFQVEVDAEVVRWLVAEVEGGSGLGFGGGDG